MQEPCQPTWHENCIRSPKNKLAPSRPGTERKKKRGLATSHGLCSHTPRVPKFHTRARDVWLTFISRATWRPRGERTLSVADSYTPYLWALGTSLLPYFPLCNYILAYSGENVNTFFYFFTLFIFTIYVTKSIGKTQK